MTQEKSKTQSIKSLTEPAPRKELVMSFDEFKLTLEFQHISTFNRESFVENRYINYLHNEIKKTEKIYLKNSTN